jgi:hypothetical protein
MADTGAVTIPDAEENPSRFWELFVFSFIILLIIAFMLFGPDIMRMFNSLGGGIRSRFGGSSVSQLLK